MKARDSSTYCTNRAIRNNHNQQIMHIIFKIFIKTWLDVDNFTKADCGTSSVSHC